MAGKRSSTWWITIPAIPAGLLFLLLLVDLFDRQLIGNRLASLVEERTARSLDMDAFDLRWRWPLVLRFENVRLANADWASDAPILKAHSVSLVVDPFELADGRPYARLRVHRPRLLLERSRTGAWNWQLDTAPQQRVQIRAPPVTVEAFGGRVVYGDRPVQTADLRRFSLSAGQEVKEKPKLDVMLRASVNEMPLSLDAMLTPASERWQGNAALRAGNSDLRAQFTIETGTSPVNIHASIRSDRLALSRLAHLIAGGSAGRGYPELTVPRLDGLDAEVQLAVATLRLRGLSVEDIEGQIRIEHGLVELQRLAARIGGIRFTGSAALDATAADPRLRLTADMARTPLRSLPQALPLSAQPGDVAAHVEARLDMADREIPLAPAALLSRLAVPKSRMLYARDGAAGRQRIVASLRILPAGGEPSVALELEGLRAPPFTAELTAPPLKRLLSERRPYPLELIVRTRKARAHLRTGVHRLLREPGAEVVKVSIRGSELPDLPGLGFTPPPIPPFGLSGTVHLGGDRWSVRGLEVRYGRTRLAGNAVLRTGGEPNLTNAELTLSAEHVKVSERQTLQGAELTVLLDREPRTKAPAGDRALVIRGRARYRGEPLRFALHGGPPQRLLQSAAPYELRMESRLGDFRSRLEGRISDPWSLRSGRFEFSASAKNAEPLEGLLKPLGVGSLPAFDLGGTLAWSGERVSIRDFAGRLGRSDLRGSVSLDLSSRRPRLDADLRSKKLYVRDVTRLIGDDRSRAQGRSMQAATDGRLLPKERFELSLLRRADADIEYRAQDVSAAAVPLGALTANVRLRKSRLLAHPVRLRTTGGRLELRLDMRIKPSLLEGVADLEVRGLNLGRMLEEVPAAANSFGLIGGQAKFWLTGNSMASLAGSADGGALLLMTGGALDSLLVETAGLDLGEAAVTAIGVSGRTGIDCAYASLHANDGLLRVDRFVVDTRDTTFFLDGRINLGRQTLDLTLHPEPKDVGFPAAESPIGISGTLKNPQVDVLSGQLAAEAVGAAALAALAGPIGALIPFVEAGIQEEPSLCRGWTEKLREETADDS